MLRIKTSNLNVGVKLGKDIFTYDGQKLLNGGTIITQEHLDGFARRNIEDAFVMEELKPAKRNEKLFIDVYQDSIYAVKEFITDAKLGNPLEPDEINSTVEALFSQLFDGVTIFKNISILKDKDDYLFTHSINVSILSMLAGKWLEMSNDDIRQLGVAGLLHDIGKVFVDSEILTKAGKLTADEFEEMKKHCHLGYDLLTSLEWVQPSVAEAVLMHHERMDGSGYPSKIKNYQNNIYAPVLAVCDIYDAITSERVYSARRSPFAAADILWEESFGKLDPHVTRVFFNRIGSQLLGSKVRLTNNEVGTVVFIDAFQPTRPLIQVGGSFINLATSKDITILEVID